MHLNGASGHFYYPEILGPGLALFDYDNDSDLDVYLVQGGVMSSGRLFRNDLEVRADGTRSLRFTDVTRESAIRATQYGLGVAAGDVDNDGWVDLLLTNFGANQLWRNNRDGTFSDVTAAIGLTDDLRFAVSAAFVDFDRDGWLNLYIANNVNYTVANETKCPNPAGRRDYCPPQIYGGRPDGCTAISGTAPSPTSPPRRWWAAGSDLRSACRLPISTATAGSTCSSPMTARRICSG